MSAKSRTTKTGLTQTSTADEPVPASPDSAVSAAADSSSASGGASDVKEQFRLALQRKRAHSGDAHVGGPDGGSKVHNASGRAANKREFRRKSGG